MFTLGHLYIDCRYLVKAAMDRVGGESVAYLVTPCEEEVVIDLSLDCLVVLFEEVAIGY